MRSSSTQLLAAGSLFLLAWLHAAPSHGGNLPAFSKTFVPDIIGPGSTSTLRFDITNTDQEQPVSGLAFVDVLPASVAIADPAQASTDCEGAILSAPAGGTTITFTDGGLPPAGSCSVFVDVSSGAVGTQMNVSGNIDSDFGQGGNAVDDLDVVSDRPGFTKAFNPQTIAEGDTSTLVFTIDNSQNNGPADFFFSDNLPDGLVVAPIPNATTDCDDDIFPPTITANPGASSISVSQGEVGEAAICTVRVDVFAETAGPKGNTSEELMSAPDGFSFVSSGKASATLGVTRDFLRKLFTDDPVPPGGEVTLEFTVTNFDRFDSATDIEFTDDLDTALSGLSAVGLPLNDPCGPGSQLSGTSTLTFVGGSLAPEASCSFAATLQVPASAAPGSYVNTTSSVTFERGGEMVVEDAAADDLIVAPVPILTKTFVDDPVTGGDTVILRFGVTNTSANFAATDITFTDEVFDLLPAATGPGADPCGSGSSAIFTASTQDNPGRIDLVGGNLPAGGSCEFDFIFDVAADASAGTFTNTTGPISATVNGVSVAGKPAADDLVVVAAPDLAKEFTDDPVLPGGTVHLEFTLELPAETPGDVTDVAFTDDLAAVVAGLVATGLPLNDVCGNGSQLDGTSLLTFTGGSLSPGESCTFGVSLAVPDGLAPGDRNNTTSGVDAMSLGMAVTSPPASDDLTIAGLEFTKVFLDDPVIAGEALTLEFTITNLSSTATVSDLDFEDDLDATLENLVASGLPQSDICGKGSTLLGLSGNTFLAFQGGSLGTGGSCTFGVDLTVPSDAGAGDYVNTTTTLEGVFGGELVEVDGASDLLSVVAPLGLLKEFLGDPVEPGATVELQFTISNFDATRTITDIAFTDDLDATLPGLTAINLPLNDVCGAGSQIAGTSFLVFSGSSLEPDSSCAFDVTLQVPAGTPSPTIAANITSEATGMIGQLPTTGAPAADDLLIESCTALDGESLVFADDTLDTAVTVEVCDFVELGPNFAIDGPNGSLTAQVGNRAILNNGTTVLSGGRLVIGFDESLQP